MAKTATATKRRVATAPVVDFTAASHEHTEPAFDESKVITGSQQQLGPFDVPAYGFMRHIVLLVEASGGTGTAAVYNEDGPFSAISDVSLLDVNGAPIVGPLSGYDLFLANLYGAYSGNQDPRAQEGVTSPNTGNFVFALRLPVEISHNDGLGSLANQNAAASYKVRLNINASASVFSTPPTTLPTVRVRGYLEAWSQPTPQDAGGRPQALVPPHHGTTQYWSKFTKAVVSGQNNIQLPRVGNLLRNVIVVFRAAGLRNSTNFPDPMIFSWDSRQLLNEARYIRRMYMGERFNHVSPIPAGVFAYTFNHDTGGRAGDEASELWIPTVQSSRLEFQGSFGAAGDLTVLTNDIAPVEVTQEERYQEFSETGFEPTGAGR